MDRFNELDSARETFDHCEDRFGFEFTVDLAVHRECECFIENEEICCFFKAGGAQVYVEQTKEDVVSDWVWKIKMVHRSTVKG